MTVLLGAHAFDVEPGDRSEVLAGADSEFVLSVEDPVVGVLDDHGDDLSGMPRAELDELAVDHEASACMHLALGPDGTSRQGRRRQRRRRRPCPVDLPQTLGRNGTGPRSRQGVVGDGVHEVSVETESDRAAGEGESDLVAAAVQGDDPVAMDLAVDLDGFAGGEKGRAAAGGPVPAAAGGSRLPDHALRRFDDLDGQLRFGNCLFRMLVIAADGGVRPEEADGGGHVQGLVRALVVVGVHPAVDCFLGCGQRLERDDVIEEFLAQGAVKAFDLARSGGRARLGGRGVMPFSRQMRSKSTSTGWGRVWRPVNCLPLSVRTSKGTP